MLFQFHVFSTFFMTCARPTGNSCKLLTLAYQMLGLGHIPLLLITCEQIKKQDKRKILYKLSNPTYMGMDNLVSMSYIFVHVTVYVFM